MTGSSELNDEAKRYAIEVADETLTFRTCFLDDDTPTGAQLAAAAGYEPATGVVVLHFLPNGEPADVRPDQVVALKPTPERFLIVESDREYLFAIDGRRFTWPAKLISGAILRNLGAIAPDFGIYFERSNEPDQQIGDNDKINLDERGMESIIARKLVWRLNVQGVVIEVSTPTITVRQAMTEAGFDTRQEWHIYFKIAGQPKREVTLDFVVDLTAPGIEKIRLTPKNVNNGEGSRPPRRDFALLEVDDRYLDSLKLRWETVIDQGRRWLLIEQYAVPSGYTVANVTLALEIPPSYPSAQIDMFYSDPPLALQSGRPIECTHIAASIRGQAFNGWSRHRGPGSEWRPATDNVVTHLALVESALAKEIGE